MCHQLLFLAPTLIQPARCLEQLEATLGDPGRYVTAEQASQISQSVKAIATVLGQRTGRNEFGGVYGEMYRKFGITSYKQVPARNFEKVMRWLENWWQNLTDDEDVAF